MSGAKKPTGKKKPAAQRSPLPLPGDIVQHINAFRLQNALIDHTLRRRFDIIVEGDYPTVGSTHEYGKISLMFQNVPNGMAANVLGKVLQTSKKYGGRPYKYNGEFMHIDFSNADKAMKVLLELAGPITVMTKSKTTSRIKDMANGFEFVMKFTPDRLQLRRLNIE